MIYFSPKLKNKIRIYMLKKYKFKNVSDSDINEVCNSLFYIGKALTKIKLS